MLLINGICKYLYRYLSSEERQTQYANSEVLSYLFCSDLKSTDSIFPTRYIEADRGYAIPLKYDILTDRGACRSLSEGNYKKSALINHFRNNIFKKVISGGGSVNKFFENLKKQMKCYTDTTERDILLNQIKDENEKKRKSYTNKILMGDVYYSRIIQNYFDKKLKQSDVSGQPLGSDDFACALYSTLYFIAFGNICQAYTEEIHILDHDREEFVEKVLTRYGCSGNPGVFQIYALADREKPNAIALFEAAELEYYGKGYNPNPDFEKVYNYCLKGVSDPKHYNPLCAWDLAYVVYHSYKKDREELKNVRLKHIDYSNPERLYRFVAEHLVKSYKSGCIAAANVIAEMLLDKDTPIDIQDTLMTDLTSAKGYLQFAADQGYVYAMNNLFKMRLAEAASHKHDEQSESIRLEAYEWLKQSADLGEPWARNKYACFLYDQGKKSEAFIYYQMAAYANDLWGMYNLLEKYYLKYLWTSVDDSKDSFCKMHIEELSAIADKLADRCLSSHKTEVAQRVQFLKHIDVLLRRSERFSSPETKSIVSKADYLDIAGELGFIDAKIADDINELISEKKQTTGLAVAWGSVKRVSYACYGTVGDSDSPSVSENTIFDIASLTKLILSISFFMLKDQRIIDLNQTIGHYCPELFPNIQDLRIIDVMRFDCKLETAKRIGSLEYDEAMEQIMQVVAAQTAESSDYQPLYSDMPALVLGILFEQIAGCSFGEFVDKNIIEPLGLKHTFWKNANTDDMQVMDYSGEMQIKDGHLIKRESKSFTVNDPKAAVLSQNKQTLMGNAGLFSSAEDIASISQALLQGRLISNESLNEIGISSGQPYNRKFGHLCYTKNKNTELTEVFRAMSGNAFAISGFTGCYWMIDPQNNCFLFIGGNRLHNRITKTDDTTLIQGGATIVFENQEYIYTKNYVYMRDTLRDHYCMKLLWENSLNEANAAHSSEQNMTQS